MVGILEGKVCLVTGASRGIGKAIVEHFSHEGAVVYANARRDGSIDRWADDLSCRTGSKVMPVYFDVTDTAAVAKVFSRIKSEQGRLDVGRLLRHVRRLFQSRRQQICA